MFALLKYNEDNIMQVAASHTIKLKNNEFYGTYRGARYTCSVLAKHGNLLKYYIFNSFFINTYDVCLYRNAAHNILDIANKSILYMIKTL